jgi:phage gpG-like protein
MAGSAAFKMQSTLLDKIATESERFALATLATIKRDYLSGGAYDILNAPTGRLRSSIQYRVANDGKGHIGITFGTDVIYAAIHEFGGDTGRNHATYLIARPFLSRGVEAMAPQLQENINTILQDLAEHGFDS